MVRFRHKKYFWVLEKIVVQFKISTFLRLEDQHCHFTIINVVTIVDQSWLKEITLNISFMRKTVTSSVKVLCFIDRSIHLSPLNVDSVVLTSSFARFTISMAARSCLTIRCDYELLLAASTNECNVLRMDI